MEKCTTRQEIWSRRQRDITMIYLIELRYMMIQHGNYEQFHGVSSSQQNFRTKQSKIRQNSKTSFDMKSIVRHSTQKRNQLSKDIPLVRILGKTRRFLY